MADEVPRRKVNPDLVPKTQGRPKGSKDKVPRKRAKIPRQTEKELKAGENKRFSSHEYEVAMLSKKPLDLNRAEQVEARIGEYFNVCAMNDMKPSLPGLASAFGVHKETLKVWMLGDKFAGDTKAAMQCAFNILNALLEDYMQHGKIPPVTGIFIGKNNFGYEDKVEQVVSIGDPLGEMRSKEDLSKKYLDTVAPKYELAEPKETVTVEAEKVEAVAEMVDIT